MWVDCIAPTPEEVRSLMKEFSIDPLLAEELLLPSYKPKVEKRGDLLYVILHVPLFQSGHHKADQEIDFIIGKHFLITARYEDVDPIHSFAQAFEVDAVLGHDTAITHGGHLFAAIVQSLYQALLTECETIKRRLHDVEEHIFKGEEKRMVAELSQVGRTLHDLHQALAPHDEMLRSFEAATVRMFGVEFTYHVHNLAGAYERIERTFKNLHSSLTELRETNNSLLTTKQNELMKLLTILMFFIFSITFVVDMYGIIKNLL